MKTKTISTTLSKATLLVLGTLLATGAQAGVKEISCGDKFQKTVVRYSVNSDTDVSIITTQFDRGPLYSSATEGTDTNNENIIYVRGSQNTESVTLMGSVGVAEIQNGILVTLKNPVESKVKITLENGKLSFDSKNKKLLEAIAGQETVIDCGN